MALKGNQIIYFGRCSRVIGLPNMDFIYRSCVVWYGAPQGLCRPSREEENMWNFPVWAFPMAVNRLLARLYPYFKLIVTCTSRRFGEEVCWSVDLQSAVSVWVKVSPSRFCFCCAPYFLRTTWPRIVRENAWKVFMHEGFSSCLWIRSLQAASTAPVQDQDNLKGSWHSHSCREYRETGDRNAAKCYFWKGDEEAHLYRRFQQKEYLRWG